MEYGNGHGKWFHVNAANLLYSVHVLCSRFMPCFASLLYIRSDWISTHFGTEIPTHQNDFGCGSDSAFNKNFEFSNQNKCLGQSRVFSYQHTAGFILTKPVNVIKQCDFFVCLFVFGRLFFGGGRGVGGLVFFFFFFFLFLVFGWGGGGGSLKTDCH